MEVEFDPVKDEINKDKHGLSLADAGEFDFSAATAMIDDRNDYGETRYRAFVRTEGVGYCLVFTANDETLRPISYRRAHEKEMRRYDL
jgi:uncharacterized protein